VNADLLEALRTHGSIEGQNVTIEKRYAEGRRYLRHSGTAGLAAKNVTRTIPIVALSGLRGAKPADCQ